ncbi:MAG: polysaccharide biosynthesis/export family protein [Bryobacterales bacterium]
MLRKHCLVSVMLALAVVCFPLFAQERFAATRAGVQPPADEPSEVPSTPDVTNPGYRLGAGDELSLWVKDAPEISQRPYRVDGEGRIKAPMIGMVEVGELSVRDAEALIERKLRPFFLDPEAAITVTTFRSQPVSVLGAVRQAGLQQIVRDTTLMEAISMAGGLTSTAGYRVRLTRHLSEGKIPLPEAKLDPNGETSSVEISTEDLLGARADAATMLVRPHDVINVPEGELVYVLGQVNRAGGFVLGVKEKVSVMRAIAMAEGVANGGAPKHARILRPTDDAMRKEIPVNLNKIMSGEDEDLQLFAGDILHVPGSKMKKAAKIGMTTALTIGTGMAIFRLGR